MVSDAAKDRDDKPAAARAPRAEKAPKVADLKAAKAEGEGAQPEEPELTGDRAAQLAQDAADKEAEQTRKARVDEHKKIVSAAKGKSTDELTRAEADHLLMDLEYKANDRPDELTVGDIKTMYGLLEALRVHDGFSSRYPDEYQREFSRDAVAGLDEPTQNVSGGVPVGYDQ